MAPDYIGIVCALDTEIPGNAAFRVKGNLVPFIRACKKHDSHHHDPYKRDDIYEECKHVSTTDSKIELIDLRQPEPVQRPDSVSIGKNDLESIDLVPGETIPSRDPSSDEEEVIEQESSPVKIVSKDESEQQAGINEANDFLALMIDHSEQIADINPAATEGTSGLAVAKYNEFQSTVLEKKPEDLKPI